MKVIQILLFLALFVCREGISQKQQYRVGIVGFYNLENLFDTDNDPNINDEEFTPDGLRKWTPSYTPINWVTFPRSFQNSAPRSPLTGLPSSA